MFDRLGAWREACDLLVAHWQPLKQAAKENINRTRSSTAALHTRAAEAGMRGEGQMRRPSYPTPPSTPQINSMKTPVPRLLRKQRTSECGLASGGGPSGDFVRAMEDQDAGKPFIGPWALRPSGVDGCDVRRSPVHFPRLVDEARKTPSGLCSSCGRATSAYGTTVTVQQLAELEEIAEVRKLEGVRAKVRRGGDAVRAQSSMRTKRRDLASRWRRRLRAAPTMWRFGNAF